MRKIKWNAEFLRIESSENVRFRNSLLFKNLSLSFRSYKQSRHLVIWNYSSRTCSWSCSIFQVSTNEGKSLPLTGIWCTKNSNLWPINQQLKLLITLLMIPFNMLNFKNLLFFFFRCWWWLYKMHHLVLTMKGTRSFQRYAQFTCNIREYNKFHMKFWKWISFVVI